MSEILLEVGEAAAPAPPAALPMLGEGAGTARLPELQPLLSSKSKEPTALRQK